jgi:hypothetical protein
MRAGTAVADLPGNGAGVFRDGTKRDNAGLIDLGGFDRGIRGLYRYNVTGLYGQRRLVRGVEISDVYRLRTRHQREFGSVRALEHKPNDSAKMPGMSRFGRSLGLTIVRLHRTDAPDKLRREHLYVY